MNHPDEYIEANHKARWLLLIYVLSVMGIVYWFIGHVDAIKPLLGESQVELELAISFLRQLINYLQVIILLHAVVLSVLLINIGIKAIGEGRFPPSGAWVMTRTKILTGARAKQKAWLSYLLAFLVWLPLMIPWYLHWLLDEVLAR